MRLSVEDHDPDDGPSNRRTEMVSGEIGRRGKFVSMVNCPPDEAPYPKERRPQKRTVTSSVILSNEPKKNINKLAGQSAGWIANFMSLTLCRRLFGSQDSLPSGGTVWPGCLRASEPSERAVNSAVWRATENFLDQKRFLS